jgi:hypothetical protein
MFTDETMLDYMDQFESSKISNSNKLILFTRLIKTGLVWGFVCKPTYIEEANKLIKDGIIESQ